MLLSNDKVAAKLADAFVTSWESVRDVPKVTIDFGGGKKLERTLAGNTVLYVLTPDGEVIDAFPGVYTPRDFLNLLDAIEPYVASFLAMPKSERGPAIAAWHKSVATEAVSREIMRTTMSKAYVESPLLKALGEGRVASGSDSYASHAEELLSDPADAFERVAARLDDMSKRPMDADQVLAEANVPGGGKPEGRAGDIITADSAANIRFVRPAVHLLLSTLEKPQTPDALKDVIYRRLLHIPLDDPYLGLADSIMPGTGGGR